MGNASSKQEPVLLVVEWSEGTPSLEQAAKRLGLAAADLDQDFGIVLIDPAKHLYAVRGISGDALSRDRSFSDPTIGHFGPR
jgi:hypothetical protein